MSAAGHRTLPAPTEPDPHWRDHAECRDAALDAFFPDVSADAATRRITERLAAAQVVARRYCAHCPVLDPCRAAADHHRDEGVRAGEYRWRTNLDVAGYHRVDLLNTDVDDLLIEAAS